jgi:hypothetical protein
VSFPQKRSCIQPVSPADTPFFIFSATIKLSNFLRLPALVAAWCSCLLVSACQPASPPSITLILSYDYCETLTTPMSWIDLASLGQIRGTEILGGQMASPQEATAYLALHKGSHATAGFGFEFISAAVHDRALDISVHWRTPSLNEVVAQVRTTPCSIFSVTPRGQIDEVNVTLDQAVFGKLSMPVLAQ